MNTRASRAGVMSGAAILSLTLVLTPTGAEATPEVEVELAVDYVDMRGLAFGVGTLWVLLGEGVVAGVDPATGEETSRFTLDRCGSPMGLAFASGFLWVGDDFYGEVSFFTPDGHQQGVESLVC